VGTVTAGKSVKALERTRMLEKRVDYLDQILLYDPNNEPHTTQPIPLPLPQQSPDSPIY